MLLVLPMISILPAAQADVENRPAKVFQDSKTKIIFYLESDRRHVSAISPEGKLLWCCDVLGCSSGNTYVMEIGRSSRDAPAIASRIDGRLEVAIRYGSSGGEGYIDIKTGKLSLDPTIN
jgi:hypothetical protein